MLNMIQSHAIHLFSSKAAPTHNMLSEQTLGLVDYHVQHAPNASIGFIDGKVKCTKQFKHYPGFWAKLMKFKSNLCYFLKREQDLLGSKEKPMVN